MSTFSKKTEKIIHSRRHWLDFVVFHAAGDLDFTEKDIYEHLIDAGVMVEAKLGVSEVADDTVARHLPASATLQSSFADFLGYYEDSGTKDRLALASAQLAHWIGAPLQIAEAAAQAKVPYVLGLTEERYLQHFERETLRTRQSVTKLLLDRLNGGARKEIAKIQELGLMAVFPETPIASLIVRNAKSAQDMLTVAVQLRSEFASYRRHLNQIEHDLASEDQSLGIRMKRAKELAMLAGSLWPESPKGDLRATAIGVSEAFLAIPELIAHPSAKSAQTVASKLAMLPVDRVLEIYRKRKVRLLLKAKRQFLNSADMTNHLGEILGVPREILRRSRSMKKAPLTAAYAAKHPDFAAEWHKSKLRE